MESRGSWILWDGAGNNVRWKWKHIVLTIQENPVPVTRDSIEIESHTFITPITRLSLSRSLSLYERVLEAEGVKRCPQR